MKRLTFALALLTLTGCSTYVAAQLDELPVGQAVRVQLNRQGAANLPPIAGVSGDQIAGTLVRRTSTEVVIHVPIEIGSQFGQDVTIPANDIVVGEVRKHHQARTMLAVAAGVGVVVAAILASDHGGALSEAPGDNTDHDAAFTARPGSSRTSIPFLRFAVP